MTPPLHVRAAKIAPIIADNLPLAGGAIFYNYDQGGRHPASLTLRVWNPGAGDAFERLDGLEKDGFRFDVFDEDETHDGRPYAVVRIDASTEAAKCELLDLAHDLLTCLKDER